MEELSEQIGPLFGPSILVTLGEISKNDFIKKLKAIQEEKGDKLHPFLHDLITGYEDGSITLFDLTNAIYKKNFELGHEIDYGIFLETEEYKLKQLSNYPENTNSFDTKEDFIRYIASKALVTKNLKSKTSYSSEGLAMDQPELEDLNKTAIEYGLVLSIENNKKKKIPNGLLFGEEYLQLRDNDRIILKDLDGNIVLEEPVHFANDQISIDENTNREAVLKRNAEKIEKLEIEIKNLTDNLQIFYKNQEITVPETKETDPNKKRIELFEQVEALEQELRINKETVIEKISELLNKKKEYNYLDIGGVPNSSVPAADSPFENLEAPKNLNNSSPQELMEKFNAIKQEVEELKKKAPDNGPNKGRVEIPSKNTSYRSA